MPPTARTISVPDNGVTRAYEALIDSVNNDDMSIVAKINTASVDRYNTVIDPKGGKFDNFRKLGSPNLWEHGKDPRRHTDPIANSQWIRTDGGQTPRQILAKPVFLKDDFARQRWEWYRDGVIKGWSVNILPDPGTSPPTKEELRSRPDWEGAQLVYRSWDLAEFSGTVIPGNAECLTADRTAKIAELVQRGLVWLPDEAKPFYESVRGYPAMHRHAMANPEIVAQSFEPPGTYRYITHEGAYWIVHAEDGKVLGKHNNKGDADAQLSAIEAHKHDKRSGRWIEGDGEAWAIFENGQRIVSFASQELATRCLEAMANPVAWTDIHDKMATEQTKRNLDVMGDVQAMLELALLGKV